MSDETTTDTAADTSTEQPEQQNNTDTPDLGDAGKKAIAAERDARKQAEKQAAEFKAKLDELEQANLSELDKAKKRAETAEQALKSKESEALKLRVASKYGITGDYTDLLVGDDEKHLEDKAKRLSELLKNNSRGPVVPNQGNAPDKAPNSADDWLRNLARR